MHDRDIDDILEELRERDTHREKDEPDQHHGNFENAIEYLEHKDHEIEFPINDDVPPSAVKRIFREEMRGFNDSAFDNETVLSGVDDLYANPDDAYAKGLVSYLVERSTPFIPNEVVYQHFPDLAPAFKEDDRVTANDPAVPVEPPGSVEAAIAISIFESAGVPWSYELMLWETEHVWNGPFSDDWLTTKGWPCVGVELTREDDFKRGLRDARGNGVSRDRLGLVGPLRAAGGTGFYQCITGMAGVAEPLQQSNVSSDAHDSHIRVKTVGESRTYRDAGGSTSGRRNETTTATEIKFCPDCGGDLSGFSSPSFCPHCSYGLPD